jgi:3-oxoacyl-[acyl-carrier protein] reductase
LGHGLPEKADLFVWMKNMYFGVSKKKCQMDLLLDNKQFVITGASAGFGRAIAKALMKEGARVIAVARRKEKLHELKDEYGEKLIPVAGDVLQEETLSAVTEQIIPSAFYGLLLNSGGPPAKTFNETTMEDWDRAYQSVFRWKVRLIQKTLPLLEKKQDGRILLIESISAKQPVENLLLSNAIRLASVGMAKTLSNELLDKGVNINVLAPGYHDTDALHRIFVKKGEQTGQSVEDVRKQFVSGLKKPIGKPEELATLALWLLSPLSRYVTGQTISHDGGRMQGVFG